MTNNSSGAEFTIALIIGIPAIIIAYLTWNFSQATGACWKETALAFGGSLLALGAAGAWHWFHKEGLLQAILCVPAITWFSWCNVLDSAAIGNGCPNTNDHLYDMLSQHSPDIWYSSTWFQVVAQVLLIALPVAYYYWKGGNNYNYSRW